MSRTDAQFKLRLPAGLLDQLGEASKGANRTITAEMVYRLEQSFLPPTPGAGDDARAEVRRLVSILAEREATRIGQNLQRSADQKQMDELVALGIQMDRDEIARLKAQIEDYRAGAERYEEIIEQLKAQITGSSQGPASGMMHPA